ncbi:unnamed protein product [Ostreobium quekettii]|uniref:Fe/B12 periplasmic-binding domain-containing protein n=1 Tax=Ostreobium quekettii TaxID=121088 RepID=A0A8S1IR34_9CHLO|nr:unnamed protein product [Ostreobium quekettii]
MRVVVVAGTFCGVGATSVAAGVMDALRRRGLRVQGFKIGPGFSDSKLVEAATGRMCVNLDPWMAPQEHLLACVHRYAPESDVAVVDGFQGLFDGSSAPDAGAWSTAGVAKLLGAPVVLVIDAAPLGHSAAPLVRGFEGFDRRLRVAGVVLNRVSGAGHGDGIREAMRKGGVKATVLGALPMSDDVVDLEEWRWAQHLSNGAMTPEKYASALGDLVTASVDIDKVLEMAETSKIPKCPDLKLSLGPPLSAPVKIAVAKDDAFSFYYHENFVMLEAFGAELVFFSPLQDEQLPSGVAAIYLGGGHPEAYAKRLTQNKTLLASIHAFAAAGGVVYAEGGGLLYLSKSIQNIGEFPNELVGVFPFRTRMAPESIWRSGYVEVEVLDHSRVLPPGGRIHGHVSHRSQVVEEIVRSAFGSVCSEQSGYSFVYRLHPQDDESAVATYEGYSWNNVVASYVHLQFASSPEAASTLVTKSQEVDVVKVFESVAQAVKVASNPVGKSPQKHGFNSDLKATKLPRIARSASFDNMDSMKGGVHTKDRSDQMKLHRYSMEHAQHTWRISTGLWTSVASADLEDGAGKKGERFLLGLSNWKGAMNRDAADRAKRSDSSLASTTGRASPPIESSASSCTEFMVPRSLAEKHQLNEKIVSMSSTCTEIVFALGLDGRLVGVTNLCDYPAEAREGRMVVARTRFDTSRLDKGRLEMKLKDFWCRRESAFELNEGFLRSAQPGVVLVEEGGDPGRETVEKLFNSRASSIGGLRPNNNTVVLSLQCHRLSEVFNFMLKVGDATGAVDAVQRIVDALRSRVARVGSLVSSNLPRESVVVLTGLNPLVVGGHWIPEMVMLAGGVAEGNHVGRPHLRISWQELRELEPEVLILAASTWEETKLELAQLASLPGWWTLPAMRTGHLYVCNHSLFTIPGPRLVDGIELLSRILHPSVAGQHGKRGMAMSCSLRNGARCRACNLSKHFYTLL